jgi:hypothetical protein
MVPMKRACYGMKRSGFDYADFANDIAESCGWKRIQDYSPCLYIKTINDRNLLLLMYVDDLLASGKKALLHAELASLKKKLIMSHPATVTRFLGIMIQFTRFSNSHAECEFSQQAYALMLVKRYCEDRQYGGNHKFRKVTTPADENNEKKALLDSDMLPGKLAHAAAKHVGGLLFLVRCTRPDLAVAVNLAARHVASWTCHDDNVLDRIFSYIQFSSGMKLNFLGYAADMGQIRTRTQVDSDHGGCMDTGRSTSGATLRIVGDAGTSCLIGWKSKRQTTTAASTPDAELTAYNDGLRNLALPITGVLESLQPKVVMDVETDNETAQAVIKSNLPKKLRYLKKTQRISIAFLHDTMAIEGHNDRRVDTTLNTSDLMTKPLGREAHVRHCNELRVTE